jgi:hypothetical protein
LVLLGTGAGCLAAWLLPGAKPGAVLGYLSWGEFVLAVLSTALVVSVLLVVATPPPRQRLVGFRTAAVWLGVLGPLIVWEAVAFLLPPGRMENPYYSLGGKNKAVDNLFYDRPPHLHWEGLSRGDLAVLNDEADPYATRVTFDTDHEGFRNSQDQTQADLIFLGDSFTEAGYLAEEDTFVQLTARALGRSARNLGRLGYSPPNELVVLREYGLKCQPRAVIWQIAEANDLADAVVYRDWVADGCPPFYTIIGGREGGRINHWKTLSPTWQLFRMLRRRQPWPLRGTFQDRTGQKQEVRFLELPGAKHSPVGHPGWPIVEQAIEKGAQLLDEKKVPLIVLLVPMKVRVLGPRVEFAPEVREKVGPDWDLAPSQTMAAHLKGLCQQRGIRFVDATPALRAAAAAGDLVYLPLDTHLSREGHQVVSACLVEAIRAAGW